MCKIKRLTFLFILSLSNQFQLLSLRFYLHNIPSICFFVSQVFSHRCVQPICPMLFEKCCLVFIFSFFFVVKTTIVLHTSRHHLVKFLFRLCWDYKLLVLFSLLSTLLLVVCCYSFIYQNKHFPDILNRF